MFNRGPQQYGYTGKTCASECSQIGATYFSLQNGGWCAFGTQDDFEKKAMHQLLMGGSQRSRINYHYVQRPDAECGQIEDRFAGYRGGGYGTNAVYTVSQAHDGHNLQPQPRF